MPCPTPPPPPFFLRKREMADALLAHGLDRLGYRYVNVDCGWSHVNRTSDGQIQADPLRFPTGMAALGRYLHQRGLLFGLYTARGKRECCGRTGYDGAEDAQRDANMFAMWGVDYLKVCCAPCAVPVGHVRHACLCASVSVVSRWPTTVPLERLTCVDA